MKGRKEIKERREGKEKGGAGPALMNREGERGKLDVKSEGGKGGKDEMNGIKKEGSKDEVGKEREMDIRKGKEIERKLDPMINGWKGGKATLKKKKIQ